ncbi:villin-4-like protein [Tanacetum coccineum]
MQQNITVASLFTNGSYYYIQNGSSVFTWIRNLTTPELQELVERQLDVIKLNMQSKLQKEGSKSDAFWEILGGKSEYPSQKITKDTKSDPQDLKVTEIYNFNQDDLMTEDVFIFDFENIFDGDKDGAVENARNEEDGGNMNDDSGNTMDKNDCGNEDDGGNINEEGAYGNEGGSGEKESGNMNAKNQIEIKGVPFDTYTKTECTI